jgi:hypothetical protein
MTHARHLYAATGKRLTPIQGRPCRTGVHTNEDAPLYVYTGNDVALASLASAHTKNSESTT